MTSGRFYVRKVSMSGWCYWGGKPVKFWGGFPGKARYGGFLKSRQTDQKQDFLQLSWENTFNLSVMEENMGFHFYPNPMTSTSKEAESEETKLNLLPPKFSSAFHGLGAARYSSPDSQKLFAKSLLYASTRLFWGPMVALLAFGFNANLLHFGFLCVTTLFCFGASIYARHYALVIYDALPPKKQRTKTTSTHKTSTI